ncbi:MAG TPA: DUF4395 domain-containing protein [Acidimicrobiales bacterium]|nr:DUF4395 domain-containing protein [Acidimicrobiales bacterium]
MATTRFGFPDPVNEVSARLVAAGVVAQGVVIVGLDQPWLIAVLAFGFVARVLAGPRFSPLGQFVTRVLTPRLPFRAKYVPGPPKRFAQAIGAALSVAAAVLHFVVGATTAAYVLVGMIIVAATLESALGFCVGCAIFGLLMRSGVIPASVCERCNNL